MRPVRGPQSWLPAQFIASAPSRCRVRSLDTARVGQPWDSQHILRFMKPCPLDVVDARARLAGLAASDVGDGRRAEDAAQGFDPLLPDPAGLASLLADLAV